VAAFIIRIYATSEDVFGGLERLPKIFLFYSLSLNGGGESFGGTGFPACAGLPSSLRLASLTACLKLWQCEDKWN
jgi:hypothetical protein